MALCPLAVRNLQAFAQMGWSVHYFQSRRKDLLTQRLPFPCLCVYCLIRKKSNYHCRQRGGHAARTGVKNLRVLGILEKRRYNSPFPHKMPLCVEKQGQKLQLGDMSTNAVLATPGRDEAAIPQFLVVKSLLSIPRCNSWAFMTQFLSQVCVFYWDRLYSV